MASEVGSIYYDVEFNTSKLLSGSKEVTSVVNNTTNGFNTLDKSVNKAESSLWKMQAAAVAVSAALAANQIIAYADAWATVNNKLANSVKVGEQTADVTDRVFKSAQNTRSSLEATATLYARLETATRKYNLSGAELSSLVETINKAFIVSGASGAEAAGAVVQLAQALGAGALRGEEFNSVNEAAPRLMEALATSLGVTRGELKEMAAQGQLTADIVLKALQQQSSAIDTEFGKTIATFSQNMTVATNELTKFVGESTVVQTSVGALGKGFVVLSQNLDTLLAVATTVTAVVGVRMVAAFIAGGGAATTAAAGVRLLGVALGALGGPVGLIITLIGAAVAAIITLGDSAEDTVAKLNNLGDANKALATAEKELAQLQEYRARATKALDIADLNRKIKAQTDYVNQLKDKTAELTKKQDENNQATTIEISNADQFIPKALQKAAALEKLREEFNKATLGIKDQNKLDQMSIAYKEQQIALEKKFAEQKSKSSKSNTQKEEKQVLDFSSDKEQVAATQKTLQSILDLNRTKNEKILLEEQARIDTINELAAFGLVTEQELADAYVAIEADKQAQILALRTAADEQEMAQRAAMVEAAKADNAVLLQGIEALGSTSASVLSGMLTGTMTLKEGFASLANTVLNEALGALVQMGVQTLRNLVIQQSVDKAMMAQKAANATAYTAAVAGQVAVNSALAAQAAFASTAAIPLVGPALAPAAAAAAAVAASALGSPAIAAAPIAGARQYGGPVSAGSLYTINEAGAPEMYTASNGKQYMLPTADGQVTSASDLQSGGWSIVINNTAGAEVTPTVNDSSKIIEIAVRQAVSTVANQISTNTGATWTALKNSSNVTGRTS